MHTEQNGKINYTSINQPRADQPIFTRYRRHVINDQMRYAKPIEAKLPHKKKKKRKGRRSNASRRPAAAPIRAR
jgi:hypothetical protein